MLLYELLTGTTPIDQERFGRAAFDEMLRMIREEEPPRPSTRLSRSRRLPTHLGPRHGAGELTGWCAANWTGS